MFITGAWLGHTPESREWAEDIRLAFRDVGLSDKAVAYTMGISTSSLSEQLKGDEMLSLWRLASLGSGFWMALMLRRCKRVGYELLAPGQLLELISSVKMLIGKKAMAKVKPLGDHEREKDVA